MQNLYIIGDRLPTGLFILNSTTKQKIWDQLPNLRKDQVNRVPESTLDEIERTPFKFKFSIYTLESLK